MIFSEADVPRDVQKNLAYRLRLREALIGSSSLRSACREACKRDLLFWVNTFLWTYNPKLALPGQVAEIPFVTWSFQDRALTAMDAALGRKDIGIEKSRETGATWMCLTLLLHRWQFHKMQMFLVSSRNEKAVDNGSDPDSLFAKLRWLLKRQPPFLLPRKYDDSRMKLYNPEMESNIIGVARTASLATGGRSTAVFMDEFDDWEIADSHEANASTFANTDCRIFNSTYKNTVGAFYQQMHREDDGIVKIRMHWSERPDRGGDLGKDEAGNWKSPYFKSMCHRLGSPVLVARELEINPEGAAGSAFPESLLKRLSIETARPPLATGRIEFDPLHPKEPVFIEDENGPLKLWVPYMSNGRLPMGDEFVIGCDISQGTGATPAVASVASKKTREKVAELAHAFLGPERFADAVHLLAHWFHGAFLIWESNGPGASFGRRITVELGYLTVYYRQDEIGLAGKMNKQMVPGWGSTTINKDMVLRAYLTALSTGSFINRSLQSLNECKDYVFQKDGSIGNPKAGATLDFSGAKRSHADRVIADALANKALPGAVDMDVTKVLSNDPWEIPDNPPPGSLAERRKQWQDEQNQKSRWESDPGITSRWNRPMQW